VAHYRLTSLETRILFEAKAWRTVVGFQTHNVPHLGHEYMQKTALTFVDGIFIDPDGLRRPAVADIILNQDSPFVEVNPS
jgi:ATP sulfurylase